MEWWLEHNFRMIQNNLRDTDGDLDVDEEIRMLKEFGANVLQIGCGGITAFTPTSLDCQRYSEYLNGDMFGRLVNQCHENGIRVIARFDFSKTHQDFFEQFPEWFALPDGKLLEYHDTYATCVNGPYMQEKSIEIIRDILLNYPVDGLFFNMFGYQTKNFYNGKPIGICRCKHCTSRFFEMFGEPLPEGEQLNEEQLEKYDRFKDITVRQLLAKIRNAVRKIRPDIPISTYTYDSVDIVRSEANSSLSRPLPFWIYAASEATAAIHGSYRDKVSSNCAINAVDMAYRFAGVSSPLIRMRLLQSMANGSNLDWCIIGAFGDYPDRSNFSTVKQVFQFHKQYEEYFGRRFKQDAKILLIQPATVLECAAQQHSREFRGIFKMLKESHRQFRVVLAHTLDDIAGQLKDFSLIIIPGMPEIKSQAFCEALKQTNAAILATGSALRQQPELLNQLFGVEVKRERTGVKAGYIKVSPKQAFPRLSDKEWVFLDGRADELVTAPEAQPMLPLVEPARYGPPERCHGHVVTQFPMAVSGPDERLYLPWDPGALYYQYGYEDHKLLLLDLLEPVLPEAEVVTDAPGCVELFLNCVSENTYLLQLINLSGYNGTTFTEPLNLHHIKVTLNGLNPKSIHQLTREGEWAVSPMKTFVIETLGDYDAYVIRT